MLHFPSPDIGMFGRRQRHARGHRIPVSIETGSGGASQDPDVAIMVDAFGADEMLLPGIDCRCCTVRSELQAALRRLFSEREQGRHFTRVVIKTSQDIAPILRTFATQRALGDEFYVESAPSLAGNNSFTLTDDTPLSWETFSRFTATLMALRGADVLGAKGLLNIDGCRGPVVVQYMQHLALPPVELLTWPDDDRTSRVEFVTRNVEERMVQSLFDSIRALSTSS
jgi:G3E family GTPase